MDPGRPAISHTAPPEGTLPPPSAALWWSRATQIRESLLRTAPPPFPESTFLLGRACVTLSVTEASLRDRFHAIYRECETPAGAASPDRTVRLTVRSHEGSPAVLASFESPEAPDFTDFTLAVFAQRGYREAPAPEPGWRLIVEPGLRSGPVAAARGPDCLADGRRAWQSLVGSHAVNSALRLQPEMIFLHAASVAVEGKGAILAGPKGSGKSTLSLAVAARGHGFLGDEVAAVDSRTWEILPFRRAVSIRKGPGSRLASRRLEEMDLPPERFPDGTTRIRAHVADAFPGSGSGAVPVRCLFFLGEPGPRTRLTEISPRSADMGRLTPLAGTLWRKERGRTLAGLLQLLSRGKCFLLDPGDPDETADLIVKTLEGS